MRDIAEEARMRCRFRLQVELLENRTVPTAIAVAVTSTHLNPNESLLNAPMVFEIERDGSLRYFLDRELYGRPELARPVLLAPGPFTSLSAGTIKEGIVNGVFGEQSEYGDVVAVDTAGGLWFYADGMGGMERIGQSGFRTVNVENDGHIAAIDANGAVWVNNITISHGKQQPTASWTLFASSGFTQLSGVYGLDTAGNVWMMTTGGFTQLSFAGGFTDVLGTRANEFIDSLGNPWEFNYQGFVQQEVDSSAHVALTTMTVSYSQGNDPHQISERLTNILALDTQGNAWSLSDSGTDGWSSKFEGGPGPVRYKMIAADAWGTGYVAEITTAGVLEGGGSGGDGTFKYA